MGHIFHDEWWEEHPSGCQFRFIMDKEFGKGNNEGKEALIYIYENKRN